MTGLILAAAAFLALFFAPEIKARVRRCPKCRGSGSITVRIRKAGGGTPLAMGAECSQCRGEGVWSKP